MRTTSKGRAGVGHGGAGLLIGVLGLAGCSAQIPATYPHATGGKMACSRLEAQARTLSSERSAQAWVLGITAGALVATGSVMAAADEPDEGGGQTVYRAVSAGLPLAGGLAGTGAFFAFTRASDASALAAVAARGVKEDDATAADVCNEAIASWNEGRAVALDTASKEKKP